jgi:cytochrome b pre-mRNA-processing protein 3
MFKSLLSLGRRPNHAVIDALYAEIVAAARQPAFYSDWNVPDTPLGRFEMLSVHVFLFLERARKAGPGIAEEAQDLTDEFFKDVEHSLRELGIGDLGVPKRMKRLAKMFYGRAEAYRAGLAAEGSGELAAALARNVRPDQTGWREADLLAAYMRDAFTLLEGQPDDALLAGRIAFPRAGAARGEGE